MPGLCPAHCSSLFQKLEKMYDPTNEEDDMVEMEEERLRMREHVMNEVCNFSLSFALVVQSETLSHASLTSSVVGGF